MNVLIGGFAKSGNHKTRFIVSHYFSILKGNKKTLTFQELGTWDTPRFNMNKPFEFRKGYPTVGYSMQPWVIEWDQNRDNKFMDIYTYLYRNPYDVMVSYFYYGLEKNPNKELINEEGIKKHIPDFMKFIKGQLPRYLKHVTMNIDIVDLILDYDILWYDTTDYKTLIKYITNDFSEDVFEKAMELSSFESIKRMEDNIRPFGIIPRPEDDNKKKPEKRSLSNVFLTRKGVPGQYKYELPEEVIGYIKDKCNEVGLIA